MLALLSTGPLQTLTLVIGALSVEAILWAGVVLCALLLTHWRRSPDRLTAPLTAAVAVVLGSLALVAP